MKTSVCLKARAVLHKKIVNFLIVGSFCATFNHLLLYVLTSVLNFQYLISYTIVFFVGNLIGFFLNKKLTFKTQQSFLREMHKYYAVMTLSLLMNLAFYYALVEYLNIWYLYASAITTVASIFYNFFMHKNWSFAVQSTPKVSGDALSILQLYDCIYPESLGGVEHRNYHLAQALANRGHRVTLAGWSKEAMNIECNSPGSAPSPSVRVLPMKFRAKLYNKDGKRGVMTSLRFALATLSLPIAQFDVIETANIPYLHLFPLAVRCTIARKPLVITWYEYWGGYWRSYVGAIAAPCFQSIEWICAQLGREVNACSQLTAKRLQANRIGSKTVLIPCGVSLTQIQAASSHADRDCPPLIYAGRLMQEKRIDLLLEAVALLPDTQQVVLTIVGDGPDRQRLHRLAEQLQISQRVEFLGRLPTIDDVWHRVARARIAVQPSSREGFGLFPLEAMATGTPVVYCESAESALSGLVRHGIDGICANPDPDSLAEALQTLLNHPEQWQAMSRDAKLRAESYDWASIAEQIEDLFYQSMQPRKR